MEIKFNIPPYVEGTDKYLKEAVTSQKICGDGQFTFLCEKLLEEKFHSPKIYLTTSGTSALEMAMLLIGIQPGDEVIMPSFTFSSSANCFAIFGGVPVFVDIRKDTMNIDEEKIEAAITEKTKAIMVVHYAGVGCEMKKIKELCEKYHLYLIEDAAQAVNAYYDNQALGTFGDIGCYSFHETKNYSMGEGGGISVNNPVFIDKAAILREKGTNRTQFINGQVDKYTWVDKGSSYLPSDILAAYLYPQLLQMDDMLKDRVNSFNRYQQLLKVLEEKGKLELPYIPANAEHNGHMFYIKCKNIEERKKLQVFLRNYGIGTAFHYIPLHSAPAGLAMGRMYGDDVYTTDESNKLLRLPMYFGLEEEKIEFVCDKIEEFYKNM